MPHEPIHHLCISNLRHVHALPRRLDDTSRCTAVLPTCYKLLLKLGLAVYACFVYYGGGYLAPYDITFLVFVLSSRNHNLPTRHNQTPHPSGHPSCRRIQQPHNLLQIAHTIPNSIRISIFIRKSYIYTFNRRPSVLGHELEEPRDVCYNCCRICASALDTLNSYVHRSL
jgi:hypothetical protein